MARRRRSGGTWFPNIGTAVGELPEESYAGRQFTIAPPVTGAIITGIVPLTFDRPFEGDGVAPNLDSLSDVIGSEYVLKRIVGSIFLVKASGLSTATTDPSPPALVGCGFFIARANDAAVGGGQDTPIGSATEAERRDNYSPLEVDTIREPWIWRRQWILGNAATQQGATAQISTSPAARAFPASNVFYGSVMDGPHIDSRVKRRVGQDDRLWFAVSATNWPLGTTTVLGTSSGVITGLLDYRIFGALRRAKGSSAF